MRQGCVLSPDLFSLYGQKCMNDLEDMVGLCINRRNVNNIQYADDTVLVADSEEKLQRLVSELQESCERRGFKINCKKTEVMGITKRRERLRVRINVQGKLIKQADSFKYLGSLISEDAQYMKGNENENSIAETMFVKVKKILVNINEYGVTNKDAAMLCLVNSNVWMQSMDFKRTHKEKNRSSRDVVSKKNVADSLDSSSYK